MIAAKKLPKPTHVRDFSNLAERLLMAVKTGTDWGSQLAALQAGRIEQLERDLHDDAHRMAFWINIYNAFTQILLATNPNSKSHRVKTLLKKSVTIAGHRFSLTQIENGLLRRSHPMVGFGYLKNPFASSIEKRLMVDTLDPRIHFALNCAANSCPPIRFYDATKIDTQLDRATRAYLAGDVRVEGNNVLVPQIFSAYKGDFGGKAGILEFVARYSEVKPPANAKISYLAYDWGVRLNDFS